MDSPATNRLCWSGTAYYVYAGLKDLYDIDAKYIKSSCSIAADINCLYKRYIKKQFISIKMTRLYSQKAKRIIEKFLKQKKYDLIFCINNPGAIAEIKTNIPIIYYSDCVASNMFDYYWFGATDDIKKEMNDVTKRALDVSKGIILSNHWAKKEAIEFYGIDENKIEVIPFGANIDDDTIKTTPHEGINLLFIGVDWERKGAQTAIECVEKLNEIDSSTKYTLHLVGCNSPYEITPPQCCHSWLPEKRQSRRKDKTRYAKNNSRFFYSANEGRMFRYSVL